MMTKAELASYIEERIIDNTKRKIQPWIIRAVLLEFLNFVDDHYVAGNIGPAGADGKSLKLDVIGGWIKWALEDSSTWNNLVNLSTLKGEDGLSPEFNNSGTHIQVRLGNSAAWTNLVSMESLRGPAGASGSDGNDGSTPSIGGNKNWWLAGADTGVRAEANDGATPYIGENKNWWINGVDTGTRAEAQDGDDADLVWASEEW